MTHSGWHRITRRRALATLLALACLSAPPAAGAEALRGTGDLGIVVERASGSLQVIETTGMGALGRVRGPGRPQPRLGGVFPRCPLRLSCSGATAA